MEGSVARGESGWSRDTKPQCEQGEPVVMDGVLRGQRTEGSLVTGA